MNTAPHRANIQGSTTVIALLTLLILTMVAVGVLRTTVPRYQVAHQASGWQEARLAADAGIDIALERLNKNVPNPAASTADWSGWKLTASTAATGLMLARSNAARVTGFTATGSSLIASPTIKLDNVDVSPTAGAMAATDIQITALYTGSGTSAAASIRGFTSARWAPRAWAGRPARPLTRWTPRSAS
jgi:Tfp pilus assembly protein PilX